MQVAQVNFKPINNVQDLNSAVNIFKALGNFPTLQNEVHAHIVKALDSGLYRFDVHRQTWVDVKFLG